MTKARLASAQCERPRNAILPAHESNAQAHYFIYAIFTIFLLSPDVPLRLTVMYLFDAARWNAGTSQAEPAGIRQASPAVSPGRPSGRHVKLNHTRTAGRLGSLETVAAARLSQSEFAGGGEVRLTRSGDFKFEPPVTNRVRVAGLPRPGGPGRLLVSSIIKFQVQKEPLLTGTLLCRPTSARAVSGHRSPATGRPPWQHPELTGRLPRPANSPSPAIGPGPVEPGPSRAPM